MRRELPGGLRASSVESAWSGRAALVAVAAAALVLVATWGRDADLLVVGGVVVLGEPLSALLVVVALLLRRRHRRWTARTTAEQPAQRPRPRLVTTALLGWPMSLGAVVLTLGIGLSTAWDVLGGVDHTTLDPEGPDGCRVIVRERSFIWAGDGEMYLVRGSTGIGHKIGAYESDDGGRPASSGAYELSWTPEGGSVRLYGMWGSEVFSGGSADFVC